jgi:hypothetical protein
MPRTARAAVGGNAATTPWAIHGTQASLTSRSAPKTARRGQTGTRKTAEREVGLALRFEIHASQPVDHSTWPLWPGFAPHIIQPWSDESPVSMQ